MALQQYTVTVEVKKKIALFAVLVSQKLGKSITLSFPSGGEFGATDSKAKESQGTSQQFLGMHLQPHAVALAETAWEGRQWGPILRSL